MSDNRKQLIRSMINKLINDDEKGASEDFTQIAYNLSKDSINSIKSNDTKYDEDD